MFRFKAHQKTFKIRDVEIGGQPGQQPTTLIGTIFYSKQKINRDENRGTFDKDEAERLIKLQEDYSDKTGNPHMIDVVGATPQALEKHIDFVASVSEAPILYDGITAEVRLSSLKYLKEAGIKNPIIYNSLTPDMKEEELKMIEDTGIESAILLTLNTKDFTTRGRIKAAEDLLKRTGTVIKYPLVDTTVIDIPTLGMACKAAYEIKDNFGVPCGAGVHNAIETWRGLKSKMGKQAKLPSIASATTMAVSFGVDFILYGQIEHADIIFPSVAMADAALAQLSIESGKPPKKHHPLFKIA